MEFPDRVLFPMVMCWLIRLAGALPKPVVNRILRRDVPPYGAKLVG